MYFLSAGDMSSVCMVGSGHAAIPIRRIYDGDIDIPAQDFTVVFESELSH
jgi:hypothetical protein